MLDAVTSQCSICGKDVVTYWHADNTGCESRPEYVLVGACAVHSECWDRSVEDYHRHVRQREQSDGR